MEKSMNKKLIMSVATLLLVSSLGCTQSQNSDMMDARIVEVHMGGEVASTKGIAWPITEGLLSEDVTIDQAAKTTIHFPDGRKVVVPSKVSFLTQHDGIVTRAKTTPLTELGSFGEALNGLTCILNQLGLADSEPVMKRIQQYSNRPPEWSIWHTTSFSARLSDEVEIFAEIKPADIQGQWYLSCGFFISRYYSSGKK